MIAYDADSDSGVYAAVTSKTFSHTVGAALSNSILLVGNQARDTSATDHKITGITYNAVALTKVRRDLATNAATEIWFLLAPASGANNVVISFTGTADTGTANAASFSGVDQTRPIADSNGFTSDSTNAPSIDFGIYLDQALIYDSMYTKMVGETAVAGSGQTDVMTALPNGGGDTSRASYKSGLSVGETTTSYSWTTVDTVAYSAVVLRPSGTTGAKIDLINKDSIRTSGSSITRAFDMGSGYSNKLLLVMTTCQDSNHANFPVTGITYNSVALTKVRSDEPAGNVRSEIWQLVAPADGSNNIVVSFTGSLGEVSISVLGLTGVDQTTPIEANTGNSGTSSAPSVSITSTSANAWLASVCVCEDFFLTINHHNIPLSPMTDQSFENTYSGVRPNKVSAGARSMTYDTNSSQAYAQSEVSIAAAAVGGAVTVHALSALGAGS